MRKGQRRQGKKKKMLLTIGILLTIIGLIVVFFHLPYSGTRAEFEQTADRLIAAAEPESGVFTEADIARLPLPVQRYFRYCGYLGTPKMSLMQGICRDVDFSLGKDRPSVKIDYTQYNFVREPVRIAYIDSSLYGIPFEGLDTYTAGRGSMKGVLAKLFTLFNQTGADMDQASLVTFLSECLMVPNAALQDYITWEAIDDLHAQATISYRGVTAGGIFTFDANGAMLSFTTDDRVAVAADGTREKVKWSAVLGEYAETDGIKKPAVLRAIWHYADGDLVYFDAQDVTLTFR